MGAPISVSEASLGSPSGTFNVSGAYRAQCSFAKNLFYPPFAAERLHTQNVFALSNISAIQDEATAFWVLINKTQQKKPY